jgi:hypothetical protein
MKCVRVQKYAKLKKSYFVFRSSDVDISGLFPKSAIFFNGVGVSFDRVKVELRQKKLFRRRCSAQSDVSLTVSEHALTESDGDGWERESLNLVDCKCESVEDRKLEPPILHTTCRETGCRAVQLDHLYTALYQLRIYKG